MLGGYGEEGRDKLITKCNLYGYRMEIKKQNLGKGSSIFMGV